MPLDEYQKIRDFKKTGEPEGNVKSTGRNIYVIQKHQASHLHWDLRLEIDGVLKSWAIPKEPPLEKGVKRLAVQTEDHPVDYADFEGEIPEGQYGAGKVEVWDRGTFKLLKQDGKMTKFEIRGKKLKGTYVLLKFTREPKNFLFFKYK